MKLKANNIKCDGCVKSIVTNLSVIEGISDVKVDIPTGEVTFSTESDANIDRVKAKLKEIGYPVAE